MEQELREALDRVREMAAEALATHLDSMTEADEVFEEILRECARALGRLS